MTSMTEKATPKVGSTHRFSFEEYRRMGEAGIFSPQDRVELVRGTIVDITPTNPKHIFLTADLVDRLLETYRKEAWIISQSPIQLLSDSEPEPDITVLKLPKTPYADRKARADDILLIIEISDTTLSYDRDTKLSLYAEAGIPEVWIYNLQDDVLEVYREPMSSTYGSKLTLQKGESVTPLFSDQAFDWSEQPS